jgi:beta-1,4-mannosyltransferase
VSSTSWTEDEDFGLLLDALVKLDERIAESKSGLPDVMVIVTGKGPQRAMYEARMAAAPLRHVAIRTAWLAVADYPRLLGAADVGVCLHTSSSGLDLPMKVSHCRGCLWSLSCWRPYDDVSLLYASSCAGC